MRLERSWKRGFAWASLVLAVGVVACSDKDDAKPDGKAGGGKEGGALEKAAPRGLIDVEPDPDVLFFTGTAGLEKVLGDLHGIATQVVPQVPPLAQMVGPALQGEFKLKDATVIDVKKPLRFALFDPKKYPGDPSATIFGVTGADKLAAALPDNKTAGTDGNAWAYIKFEGSKHPVYVNFLGDFVVLTRDKSMFANHKAFLQKLVDAEMADAAGAAVVPMKNVVRVFGAEIEEGIAEAKKQIAGISQATPGGEAQLAMVGAIFDWMAKAPRELDAVHGRLLLVGDGLKTEIDLRPIPGSGLEKSLRGLEGRGDSKLVARLPAGSPFFALMSTDPAKSQDVLMAMVDAFFAPMLGGDAAKVQSFKDQMKAYLEALDGDFAFAAHGPPGQGLSLAALFGVKDAAKAREANRQIASVYQEPTAAAYYKQMGVEMALKKDAYTVGDVPVDIVESQLTQLPPEAAPMAAMLSGFMTQHVAIGKDLGVIAYGTDGKAGVEGFLTGSIKGGLDQDKGVQRALKHKAENTWLLMYVVPVDLARELKLGGMNPLAAMLVGIDGETGVAISTGGRDGTMKIVFDVPVEAVQKAYQGFEKSKGSF